MNSQTGTANLNGTTFAYEIAGEGTPLVGAAAAATPAAERPAVALIHAGIADSRMWGVGGENVASQFEALAEAYTVVRYDLRGFGRTPPLVAGLDEEPPIVASAAPPQFAHQEDLAALLLHLGLGRVALVGCSIGSRIALDFTLRYPERVDRLVMVSPTVSGLRFDGPPPAQAAELEAAEEAGDLARVNELEMQIWVDGPHRRPDEVDSRVRALAREMNAIALANEGAVEERPPAPPAAGRLAEVRAPVLIIAGELDQAKTRAAADFLAAHLPQARLELIPGAAHLPNIERPAEINRLLLSFLAEE
jgi:pimeloyl-ACP methyl ester carboxylesterase